MLDRIFNDTLSLATGSGMRLATTLNGLQQRTLGQVLAERVALFDPLSALLYLRVPNGDQKGFAVVDMLRDRLGILGHSCLHPVTKTNDGVRFNLKESINAREVQTRLLATGQGPFLHDSTKGQWVRVRDGVVLPPNHDCLTPPAPPHPLADAGPILLTRDQGGPYTVLTSLHGQPPAAATKYQGCFATLWGEENVRLGQDPHPIMSFPVQTLAATVSARDPNLPELARLPNTYFANPAKEGHWINVSRRPDPRHPEGDTFLEDDILAKIRANNGVRVKNTAQDTIVSFSLQGLDPVEEAHFCGHYKNGRSGLDMSSWQAHRYKTETEGPVLILLGPPGSLDPAFPLADRVNSGTGHHPGDAALRL